MGCICSKSNENSNVNLDPLLISNNNQKIEDSMIKKENNLNVYILEKK